MENGRDLDRPDVSLDSSSRRVSNRYLDLSHFFDCPACGTWVRVNTHCEQCGRLYVLPEIAPTQQTFTVKPSMAHGVKLPENQFTDHQTDIDDFEYGPRQSMPINYMKGHFCVAIGQGPFKKYSGYRLGAPGVKAAIQDGSYIPPESFQNDEYQRWVDDVTIMEVLDTRTGETYKRMTSKLGNLRYTSDKEKQTDALIDSVKGLEFSMPVSRGRGLDRECLAWFCTFNYDHKHYTKLEAWARAAKDVTDFKRRAKRLPGFHSSFSICVKEGGESGYPAFHMFIILAKPLIAYLHKGGAWRVKSTRFLYGYDKKLKNGKLRHIDGLKDKWTKSVHGFIDFQAAGVDDREGTAKSLGYGFKYVTKPASSSKVALETFAKQKLLRYRPMHISSGFRQMATLATSRLDTSLRQSPHRLLADSPSSSPYEVLGFEYSTMAEYSIKINDKPPIDGYYKLMEMLVKARSSRQPSAELLEYIAKNPSNWARFSKSGACGAQPDDAKPRGERWAIPKASQEWRDKFFGPKKL